MQNNRANSAKFYRSSFAKSRDSNIHVFLTFEGHCLTRGRLSFSSKLEFTELWESNLILDI